MDTGGGQRSDRRLGRREAPVIGWKRQKLVLTEVALDDQRHAELTTLHAFPQVKHGRFEAPLMTNAATYTGSLNRCEGALRFLACRAEWLLAEHMLSSPRTHSDLLGMEFVWRTQDEGFDTSFRESSFQAVRSAE